MKHILLSWNVNGIRAVQKKGFLPWLETEKPFLLGVQETKAHPEQLDAELLRPPGYHTYWSSAEKKGYSGVAVFAREEPLSVAHGFGVKAIDSEGRILVLEYPQFYFLSIYFPNGKASPERLAYKLNFYREFLDFVSALRKKKKPIVVCGDVNTAHTEKDLARPKENRESSGFLPVECEWLDTFIKSGLRDTFRQFNNDSGHYTWWDFKTRARERNVGWRIDYFYVTADALTCLKDAFILKDVPGSDHCPIGITLAI